MHKAAGVLLILAAVFDLFAGFAYGAMGLMGAGMMQLLGAMGSDMLAIAGGGSDSFVQLAGQGAALGGVLAGVGLLVVIAAVLAALAAIRLLARRGGTIIYIGSGAALIAEAGPLLLIGFNPFQIPGLVGGVLGIFVARKLDSEVSIAALSRAPAVKAPLRPPDVMAIASILIGVVLLAMVAYLQFLRPVKPPAAATAQRPVSPAATRPAPVTGRAPSAARAGVVAGEVAAWPFESKRAVLDTKIWTKLAGKGGQKEQFEKLALVFEQRDDLKIEISGLPDDYDLRVGLSLRVDEKKMDFNAPSLTLSSPKKGSSFANTDFVRSAYSLDLQLEPLDGNRVKGRISLAVPANRTRIAGEFHAWVDGQLEIEPDLSRGGSGSFKYLVYQHLKNEHPGARISIIDSIWSHQSGDATKRQMNGHAKVLYTIGGEQRAATFLMATTNALWGLVGALPATQLPEAHPLSPPDPTQESAWVRYLAAQHSERWLQSEHPGKHPWSASHLGTTNTKLGYADIRMRLKFYGESDAIERRYYFRRDDGQWRFVRELGKDERIDRETSSVDIASG